MHVTLLAICSSPVKGLAQPQPGAAPERAGDPWEAPDLQGLSFSSSLDRTIPGKQGLVLGMKSWHGGFWYENLNTLSITVLKIAKLMKPEGMSSGGKIA